MYLDIDNYNFLKFERKNMKKTAIIILVLLAMVQIAWSAEFSGTYTEAKAQATKLGKPLLLDFFADW